MQAARDGNRLGCQLHAAPHQSGSWSSGRSGGSCPFFRMLSPVHTSLDKLAMPAGEEWHDRCSHGANSTMQPGLLGGGGGGGRRRARSACRGGDHPIVVSVHKPKACAAVRSRGRPLLASLQRLQREQHRHGPPCDQHIGRCMYECGAAAWCRAGAGGSGVACGASAVEPARRLLAADNNT